MDCTVHGISPNQNTGVGSESSEASNKDDILIFIYLMLVDISCLILKFEGKGFHLPLLKTQHVAYTLLAVN